MDWEILVSADAVPDIVNVAVAGITAVACLITSVTYSWWFWQMQRRDSEAQARWVIFWIAVVKSGLFLWAAMGVVQNIWFDAGQPLLTLPFRLLIMVGTCGHASLAFMIRPRGPEPFAGAGPRVLVVEDDELLARVYQKQLGAAGYSCSVVSDAWAAVQHATLYRPDLVIVDYVLPGPSGDEAADMIRETGYAGPFISISGDVDARNGRYARILQKPIRIEELIEAVREELK